MRCNDWRAEQHYFFPIDVTNLNDKLTSAFAGSLITVNNEKVLILCLYNPPSNSKYRVTIDKLNSFFCFLDNDEWREIKVIEVGDFNLPSVNWKTLESADLYEKQLVNLFDCQLFIPVVFFPTCGKNALDQIFVYDDSIVIGVKCDDSVLKIFSFSDLIPILLDLDLSPATNEKTELNRILSFSKCDYVSLKENLRLNPFNPICFSNCDRMLSEWYHWLFDTMTKFTPRRSQHRSNLPPWITPATSHLMKKLNTRQRKPNSLANNDSLRLKIETSRNRLAEAVDLDQKNYESKLFNARNSQAMYKYFKSLRKRPSVSPQVKWNKGVANCDAEKASLFNKYFGSIFTVSLVFKNSLNENKILNYFTVTKEAIVEILGSSDVLKSCGPDNLPAVVLRNCAKELRKSGFELLRNFRRLGTYPSAWKIGAVGPIFKKKRSKADVVNYRPVTLLCIVSKVLGKFLYGSIVNFFKGLITD